MPENAGSVDKMLVEYDSKLSLHENFRVACEGLVRQLLRLERLRVHSVTSRVKERSHLAEKLSRLGKDYAALSDVSDIVGVRVITHFEDEVNRIAEVVEREFQIDPGRSVDKRKALDPDRFGYISLHFICSIRRDRAALAEYREFAGICCEIQVRSILQHAWAEIEHDLGYKAGAPIPAPIRRRFSRLAGLLEIGDREFTLIRDDLAAYAERVPEEIRQSPASVGVDDVSLIAFIRGDATVIALDGEMASYVGAELRDQLPGHPGQLAGMVQYVGISTIEDLRVALETRKKVVLAQFKRRLSGERHEWLGRGISVFHLFQVMVAEKNDPREMAKAFAAFGFGEPSNEAVPPTVVETFNEIKLVREKLP